MSKQFEGYTPPYGYLSLYVEIDKWCLNYICKERRKYALFVFDHFYGTFLCCCLILNDLTLNDCLSIMMRDKINNPSITPKSNAG